MADVCLYISIKSRSSRTLVLLINLSILTSVASGEYAVIHAQGPLGIVDACALYNPKFSAIPLQLEKTKLFQETDSQPKYTAYVPSPSDGCTTYYIDRTKVSNASAFVYTGNCSNFDKELKAVQAGAKQLILVSHTGNDYPKTSGNEHHQIHIPVGMILDSTWNVIKSLGDPISVQLWHPHEPPFDPNLVVIWGLAFFTVFVGAYWSGITTQQSGNKQLDNTIFDMEWGVVRHEKAVEKDGETRLNSESNADHQEEEPEFPITPVMVLIFVLVICTVLLLLYFFYKYLIYAVIGLFALAALNGTYDCFQTLVKKIPFGDCYCPTSKLPYCKRDTEVRLILLFFVCLGLVIWWVIERHAPYAWALQDFLGICFCISLIKLIKLPNLKISTILLIALLIYDIFFVFITPLFSARGKSVMVEVATGKGSKEQLPMVIKVPKIIKTAMSVCERPYSLLGFGDILLPGLFIGFCHNFDVIAKTPCKIYFLASSVGYGIGLIATFVALIFMKVGQPALLYLVPSILLSAVIVGATRKELKSLWQGKVVGDHNSQETTDPPSGNSEPPKDQDRDDLTETERLLSANR